MGKRVNGWKSELGQQCERGLKSFNLEYFSSEFPSEIHLHVKRIFNAEFSLNKIKKFNFLSILRIW